MRNTKILFISVFLLMLSLLSVVSADTQIIVGNSNVPVTANVYGAGIITVNRVYIPSELYVNKVSLYVSAVSSNVHVRALIYGGNETSPNNLLFSSESILIDSTENWVNISLSNFILDSGYAWVGVIGDGNYNMKYDSIGNGTVLWYDYTGQNFNDIPLLLNSTAYQYSLLIGAFLTCTLIEPTPTVTPQIVYTGVTVNNTTNFNYNYVIFILLFIICICLCIKKVPILGLVVGFLTLLLTIVVFMHDSSISIYFSYILIVVGFACMVINGLDIRRKK